MAKLDSLTVRDVAKEAGVSPITVSRVLNNSPKVAATTAERVRQAMRRLGYRPNLSARNLRQRRLITTVGLVVGDIANPFFASLSRGVELVAHENGALVVVSSCGPDPSRERDVVETLLAHGVDGILLYSVSGEYSYLTQKNDIQRPFVLLGSPGDDVTVDAVLIDNVGGARRAVEHLCAHGHRRIGVIAYGGAADLWHHPGIDDKMGRLEGYRRALDAADIGYDPSLVHLSCTPDQVPAVVGELLALPDPPTALFTMNNRITVAAIRTLGLGLRGIAIVGFDDFELADMFEPPISVVTRDPRDMGTRAASLLFARLGGSESQPRQETLPIRLIARGSGELTPKS